MKAILEFNLPDDDDSFKMAKNGCNYWLALWNMDQYLRGQIKHAELGDSAYKQCELLRDKLHEFLADEGVTLE